MPEDTSRWRAGFELACGAFAEIVALIPPESFEAHGLGVWTIRDLVGHGSRSLVTIETYLATPATSVEIDDAVDYYRAVATASLAAGEAVAQRGRDAGLALGRFPEESVRALAQRVRALVNKTPDEVAIATPLGTISFGAYLSTRVFELTVHSLDLIAALELEQPRGLDEPVRLCLELAAGIAGRGPASATVLLALTGRTVLPQGFSVV